MLPHTADVMVSAWAPTVEGCLAQAVRGMVSCFADIRTVRPERLVVTRHELQLERDDDSTWRCQVVIDV